MARRRAWEALKNGWSDRFVVRFRQQFYDCGSLRKGFGRFAIHQELCPSDTPKPRGIGLEIPAPRVTANNGGGYEAQLSLSIQWHLAASDVMRCGVPQKTALGSWVAVVNGHWQLSMKGSSKPRNGGIHAGDKR